MVQLLVAFLGAAFVVRVLIGFATAVRWAPVGDPALVGAMRSARPRVRARTACIVVDRSDGNDEVTCAFNGCTRETRFELGSVAKAFTGMLIADGVERGELALESRLGELLPELAETAVANVTVADLAGHRSGLPGSPLGATAPVRLGIYAYLGLDPYRGIDVSALLRIATRTRLRSPGTERYSNLGAALAGHAVARSAHLGFQELFARRIAGPLKMTATSADPRTPRGAGRGALGAWAQPWRLDGYGPAGGVTSTPADLTLLMRALLEERAPGATALSQGLFWQIHTTDRGRRRIWHNGQTGGYACYLAIYPEARKAVVVVSSHANASRQERLASACVTAHASHSTRDSGQSGT